MRWTSTLACLRFCNGWLLALALCCAPALVRAQAVPAGQGLVADSTELRVLRQFYYATGGDGWANRANWPASAAAWQAAALADAAGWAGVGLGGGDVTALNLAGNGLRGTVPPGLGQLRALYLLSVQNNQLTGPVPAELGQLGALQHLNLFNNQLTGPVPAELGQLGSLLYLNLFGNQLTGPIPAALGQLYQVRDLNLFANQLSGPVPAALGQLRNLQYLNLNDNRLSGPLLPALGPLNPLQHLRLQNNAFTFGPLEALFTGPNAGPRADLFAYSPQAAPAGTDTVRFAPGDTLRLRRGLGGAHTRYRWQRRAAGAWQDVAGAQDSVLTVAAASAADSGAYRVTATNDWVTGLTLTSKAVYARPGPADPQVLALRAFYEATDGDHWVHHDRWPSGEAAWAAVRAVAQCRGWYGLDVREDTLRGIALGSDHLRGYLPAALGRLRELEYFDCNNNELQDAIPAALGTLPRLAYLNLDHNLLRGPVPAALGGLAQLVELTLDHNRFSGPFPAAVLRCAALGYLHLDHNQFQDAVPAALGGLAQLTDLALDHNRFSGAVPPALARLPRLQALALDANAFTDLPGWAGAAQVPAAFAVQDNVLAFAPLEANFTGPGQPLPGFTYAPQRTPPGADTVRYARGDDLRLSRRLAGAYNAYQWERQAGPAWVEIPGATAPDLTVPGATEAQRGLYRLRVTNAWVPNLALYPRYLYADLLPYAPLAENLPVDADRGLAPAGPRPAAGTATAAALNFVRTYTPRVALTDAAALGADTVAVARVQVTTAYLDGLGRPVQTVLRQETPGRRDWVQPVAYDALGREPRRYLPYAAPNAAGTAGDFRPDALADQYAFYADAPTGPGFASDGVARTGTPYAETAFEAAPLNRALARGAPGEAWQLAAGHPVTRAERPNTAADSVRQWWVDAAGALATAGYYPAGELWATETVDEQGARAVAFADKQGNVVAKRVQHGWARRAALAGQGGAAAGPLVLVAPAGWLVTGVQAAWYGTGPDCRADVTAAVQALAALQLRPGAAQLVLPADDAHWGDPCAGAPADLHVVAIVTAVADVGAGAAHNALTATAGEYAGPLVLRAPPGHRITAVQSARWGSGVACGLDVTANVQRLWAGALATPADSLVLSSAYALRVNDPCPGQAKTLDVVAAFDPPLADAAGAAASVRTVFGTGTEYAGPLVLRAPAGHRLTGIQGARFGHGVACGGDVTARVRQLAAPQLAQQGDSLVLPTYYLALGTGDPCPGQPKTLDVVATFDPPLPLAGGAAALTPLAAYLETAYAFDDFARLRAVLPPRATQRLRAPAGATSAALDSLLFRYRYDGRGRLVAKRVPGQDGEVQTVYDQLDRPVLAQDPAQRARGEWAWTKYDALGRAVLTGLAQRTAPADALQQEADQAAGQYEQPAAGPPYYTLAQAYPPLGAGSAFGAGQVLTATYYDGYDYDGDGTPDAAFDNRYAAQFAAGQAPAADGRVQGLATRTQVRVLGVAENDPQQAAWLTTTTFYDDRARPVQVQATNARGGQDVVTSQLDFTGKVRKSYAVHQGPSQTAVAVAETYGYDHAGRLVSTRQQVAGADARPVLVDSVDYNELGQVLRKTLAPGTGLEQRVDYAYNARGWLTGVNEALVALADPASRAATGALWGLELRYEHGFTPGYEQYGGNVGGQLWRGRDGVARAYGYAYDRANRLVQGDYVAQTPTGGAWTGEHQRYGLSFVSYDANGNVLTLRRQGLLAPATRTAPARFGPVDNLEYAYQGNRLQAVDDRVTGNALPRPAGYHGAPTSLAGDFQEAGVHQSQEYAYDANGSLTSDANKGITGILYNHLSLPRQIHFGSGADSVVFRYTAAGQKVAKLVYQTGKDLVRTDYLGPYQYEGDSLRFFPHAEGRVLRFVQKDPAGQATVRYEREYTLKDHLGNLRLAYRLGHRTTYTATLEPDEPTRKRETHQFDSLSVSYPVAQNVNLGGVNRARTGSYVAKLNAGGSAPQPLGPLKQLAVQKGDTITVTAPGYYPQAVQNNSFAFSLAGFVASLLQQQPAPAPGVEGPRRSALPLLSIGVSAALPALVKLSV